MSSPTYMLSVNFFNMDIENSSAFLQLTSKDAIPVILAQLNMLSAC